MGQFLHFCIPIMPIMILCMFFIKLIVQIPFVQLLNPFIASIHSILLTLFYYCVPTFTERTLDDTLSLVKIICLQGIKWTVIIGVISLLVMTGLDAYLNEVVSKTDLAYSIDTIKLIQQQEDETCPYDNYISCQYRINPLYYDDFRKYFDTYIRPQM